MFDVESIRKDFPILDQKVFGHSLIYLDNAATMQMPQPVLDAIVRHYHSDNANVHRGIHALSERSTRALESARDKVRRFINAQSSDEIVFTSGTTGAINMLADMWDAFAPSRGAVATTVMEHHANFVPWQQLCARTGRRFLVVGLDDRGDLDLDSLKAQLVENEVSLLAVTHVSNVLGTVNPVREIVQIAHEHGAYVLVDAAQSIRHEPVDVRDIGCDFLAFSGHKMGAPTGIGVLYGRLELLEQLEPARFGGEMVDDVRTWRTTFAQPPLRFEAGTPNYVGALGLGAAIDYLEKTGREDVRAYEHELVRYAEEALGGIAGLQVLGNPRGRGGCLSFSVQGAHPFDIATLADKLGVALRSGNQCAQPLLYEAYDLGNITRMSPALYNTRDEIDQACEVLERVVGLVREFR